MKQIQLDNKMIINKNNKYNKNNFNSNQNNFTKKILIILIYLN